MVREYFRKRLKDPVIALLGQGLAPSALALSLACGAALGIFPVVGTTTILCLALAVMFRLSIPAVMLANWAVYPLQIMLMAPFFMAGRCLFGPGHILHAPPRLTPLSTSGMAHGAGFLLGSTLHAILVWCLAAPVFVVVLYLSLLPALRGISRTRSKT